MRRERARDDGLRQHERGIQDRSEVGQVLPVLHRASERQEWPPPPLHVVIPRDHEHRGRASQFPNEGARGLILSVSAALRQIAGDHDHPWLQVRRQLFDRLDLRQVGDAAEMGVGEMQDAERHASPALIA